MCQIATIGRVLENPSMTRKVREDWLNGKCVVVVVGKKLYVSQEEKEAVLKRVKDGEIDLLYLSPETLLSYSIETLIGDREIGLLIVDEAHIVTTWGV